MQKATFIYASLVIATLLLCGCSAFYPSCGCSWQDADSGFVYTAWAPLKANNNFRVNGPDAATGKFKDRWEAKQTGLLEMDLPEIAAADIRYTQLYCELWGGHPGIVNKGFAVNGGKFYSLPEVGGADHNCVYSYPAVDIAADELRGGKNEIQFSCETGTAFWSHYLVRQVAVKYGLTANSKIVHEQKLEKFAASVMADHKPASQAAEVIKLSLAVDPEMAARVESVTFQGKYFGYDDNGDGDFNDWHGFTKDRQNMAFIGSASADEKFAVDWDVSMLADQEKPMEVRAIVSFAGPEELSYITPAVVVTMPARRASVKYCGVSEMPKPFWSRADKEKVARIILPDDISTVKRARLHFMAWDGGAGTREDYFTINGHQINVAANGKHEVIYTDLEIDPTILKPGENVIILVSETHHHGIEGLLPGPAIIIRCE